MPTHNHYIEYKTDKPFIYNRTGKFEAPSPNWKHAADYPLIDHELIVVTDDVLYLTYAEHNYTVPSRSFLLLPPLAAPYNMRRGFRSSACSFYWLHFDPAAFSLRNVLSGELDEYLSALPENTISLPIQGSLPNFARSIIYMRQLQDAVRNQYDAKVLNYLSTIVLYDIFYQLSPITSPPKKTYVQIVSQAANKKNLKKHIYYDILDYIKANIDRPMKVENIAFHFGYNEKYISHLFKMFSGITLKQYILNSKIELANFYLSDTNKPIVTIAKSLGFTDSHNFATVYKKIMGITPSEYRDACAKRILYHV